MPRLERQTPGAMGLGANKGGCVAFAWVEIAGEGGPRGGEPFPAGRKAQVMANAREAALKMLGERALGATVCPSEVARTIALDDLWRKEMPTVHATVDDMLAEGVIHLSWKGQRMNKRKGPYRISLQSDD